MEDEESDDSPSILDAAEALAPESEKAETTETVEEVAEEVSSDDATDYSSMTVAELKELLKAAGKPVSGKKSELIERLSA
jgi:hypothetical protein